MANPVCIKRTNGKCVKWRVSGESGATVSIRGLGGGRDVTENFVRKRQFAPSQCAEASFRTKKIGGGKMLVICCPKGKWDAKRDRCKVGTRAQSILKPR